MTTPTYIEDLHVVGDGYDGELVTDISGNKVWDVDQCVWDIDAVSPSNKMFYDAQFYIGNTANINDAT